MLKGGAPPGVIERGKIKPRRWIDHSALEFKLRLMLQNKTSGRHRNLRLCVKNA